MGVKSLVKYIVPSCPFLFMAIFTFVMMQSCGKMPINGDLDGKWQVMEVIDDGVSLTFPEGKRYYFNFYLHVCQLAEEDGYIGDFTANMSYANDVLTLDFPYVKEGKVSPSSLKTLKYWGVPTNGEVVFRIGHLSSSGLEMSSGTTIVRCRKF